MQGETPFTKASPFSEQPFAHQPSDSIGSNYSPAARGISLTKLMRHPTIEDQRAYKGRASTLYQFSK